MPCLMNCKTRKKLYLHIKQIGSSNCLLAERTNKQTPLRQGHVRINHSAARRVGGGAAVHLEEPRVDPLADDDVGKLQLGRVDASVSEALLDGLDLVLHHVVDLAVAHPVPVQDDPLGQGAVQLVVLIAELKVKHYIQRNETIKIKDDH